MKCDSLVFSGYFDGRIDDYVSFLQWNTTTGKVTIFFVSIVAEYVNVNE